MWTDVPIVAARIEASVPVFQIDRFDYSRIQSNLSAVNFNAGSGNLSLKETRRCYRIL